MRKIHQRQESQALCRIFASLGTVPVIPDPDSTAAESEPADPESERASASQDPQPAGNRFCQYHSNTWHIFTSLQSFCDHISLKCTNLFAGLVVDIVIICNVGPHWHECHYNSRTKGNSTWQWSHISSITFSLIITFKGTESVKISSDSSSGPPEPDSADPEGAPAG